MEQKRFQTVELSVKIISLVTVVAGLGWGAMKYFDTTRQGYYMQLWNKKLEYYLQTSAAVADISTADSTSSAKEDIDTFWSLYYGPMALLEDENVKQSMQVVAGFVSSFEGKSKASGVKTRQAPSLLKTDPEFMKAFRDASYNLAKQMQLSLQQSRTRPFDIPEATDSRRNRQSQ